MLCSGRQQWVVAHGFDFCWNLVVSQVAEADLNPVWSKPVARSFLPSLDHGARSKQGDFSVLLCLRERRAQVFFFFFFFFFVNCLPIFCEIDTAMRPVQE